MKLDPEIIHERLNYPRPTLPPPATRDAAYEWKLADRHGNAFGRWLYRPRPAPNAKDADAPWTDVFGHEVHQSEFRVGRDFAVTAIADDEAFRIVRVNPPAAPKEIFRQTEKLALCDLSTDERFILVQSAQNGNWYRPELLVLDMAGTVLAHLGAVDGVDGCFAHQGAWAPAAGDARIAILHEASGFAQPAIWHPFANRIEKITTGLEGEIGGFSQFQPAATWDRTGEALILLRSLNGRSDLHRLHLATHTLETLQPHDGTIFRHECDAENRVVGLWASNATYGKRFRETERFPTDGFRPTRPLHRWHFRRIAGVPCFVVGLSDAKDRGPRWTIFDPYGMPGYHYADGYNGGLSTWVDHGFQLVLLNTHGTSGFGRAWRESTSPDLGFIELEDLRQVRTALIDEGVVDERRAILSGASWGGLMTLLGMGTQPDLWAMGLASVPVGDYEACHWEASPLIRAVNRTMFGGNARTHAAAYRRASPLTYVDQVRRPILISTGRDDLLCPLQQNLNYVEALRARGGICDLHVFEGGHAPANVTERTAWITRQLEFAMHHTNAFDQTQT